MMENHNKRRYRYKNSVLEFFCPLCRVPRAICHRRTLSGRNYLQIALLGTVLTAATYDLMAWRSFFWVFPIWAGFEFAIKLLHRKEIPCPDCGFDATWYKRDVRVAKRLVQDFWQNKNSLPQEQVIEKTAP